MGLKWEVERLYLKMFFWALILYYLLGEVATIELSQHTTLEPFSVVLTSCGGRSRTIPVFELKGFWLRDIQKVFYTKVVKCHGFLSILITLL